MSKKQLYLVITFLLGVLLYMLFVPVSVTNAPEQQGISVETETLEEIPEEVIDNFVVDTQEEQQDVELEIVTLEGTFVGFVDGENVYKKKFKYMLLNDGIEILRIDLRPLIGYSDLNLIEKLGVDRGDVVVVTGVMNEGEFKVQNIK